MPRLEAIVISCREPATLASFFAGLLGLAVSPQDAAAIAAGTLGEGESVLLGSRDSLHVWLTPVGDLQPVPGRVHLDVRMHAGEDPGQLIALGATWQWDDPRGRWTVFADPEGNLFCAIPRQRERRAQMSLGLAAPDRSARPSTAQDAQIWTARGRPASSRHPRRSAATCASFPPNPCYG